MMSKAISKTAHQVSRTVESEPLCRVFSGVDVLVLFKMVCCHPATPLYAASSPYSSKATGLPALAPAWSCCVIHVLPQLGP